MNSDSQQRITWPIWSWTLTWVGVLLANAAPANAQTAPPDDFETRWEALGLAPRQLAAAENPALTLSEPLTRFQKQTEDAFRVGALNLDRLDRLPRFTDFRVDDETLASCREIQGEVLRGIARGPGLLPNDLLFDSEEFNVFAWLFYQKANRALAASALEAGEPMTAARHLSHSLTAARFLLSSEPNLIAYLLAVNGLRSGTTTDLIHLAAQKPDPELFQEIVRLLRENKFDARELTAAIRAETRLNLKWLENPKESLRKWHETAGAYWTFWSEEPLASLSLEQLLALSIDRKQSRRLALDDLEVCLRWIAKTAPLSAYPSPHPKPNPLAHYQEVPNGFYEIFRDCTEQRSIHSALIANRVHDALAQTALAWLRAEFDGVSVASLSDLVPEYLEAIPRDPADGKPLRGRIDRRVVYSIGPDLADDAGRSGFETGEDDDPTFDLVIKVPELVRE